MFLFVVFICKSKTTSFFQVAPLRYETNIAVRFSFTSKSQDFGSVQLFYFILKVGLLYKYWTIFHFTAKRYGLFYPPSAFFKFLLELLRTKKPKHKSEKTGSRELILLEFSCPILSTQSVQEQIEISLPRFTKLL